MSIHDKLNKNLDQIRDQIESEEKGYDELVANMSNVTGAGYSPSMKSKDYLKAAVGWVYGCVGVISDEIAGIQLKLMQIKNGESNEVDDHPALDLIYRPNNVTTKFDLIKLSFQYLELTGEAPWFVSIKNGAPSNILLLRPDRLTVKPGANGELIGGYSYRIYGSAGVQEIALEPQEIILLKYPDPDMPLRGKGPLQAAATTYDLDNYSERWNTKFFKNSASPDVMLKTEQKLAKETRERLERKLQEKYRGLDNSHKTIILEAGLSMEKLTLSQKEMDFIEQQRFSRDKMLAIFRVPRTALGITDDVNRANAEATDYVFAKRTIKPKMMGFVEQLNEFFLPLFAGTEQMVFSFEDPVPENVDQDIAKATAGIQGAFMTINEARELVDLDPIDGGDVIREPMTQQPIQNDPNQQNALKSRREKPKPTRAQKHYLKAKNRDAQRSTQKLNAIKEIMSEALTPVIYDSLKQKYINHFSKRDALKHKIFATDPKEAKLAKYAFQEKQLKLADSFEPKVIAKLNKVFEIQKDYILKSLDNDIQLKLDVNIEKFRYVEMLKPVMLELMRAQSKLAFQLLGQQKNFAEVKAAQGTFTQRLSDYFEQRFFKIAPEITRETNSKLQDVFATAADKKQSIPEIKKSVSELFDNMEGYRSERIARTETIRGSNFSTEQAYIDSGVVEAKEWLTTKDERTDDECFALDGKVIALKGSYESKADNGYEQVDFPPIHVNCRCTLIPVIGTPLKEGQWKASMNLEQANAFIKDSQLKQTLFHGTTDKAAENIQKNGFNLSLHDIGEGVYLAPEKKVATQYAEDAVKIHGGQSAVVAVKVNAKNLKVFADTKAFVDAIEASGAELSDKTATAFIKQFDAVKIKDIGYIIVPNPKNIVAIPAK